MRPSAAFQARIKNRVRFTTKNVGKGFYRGTGTGALGAHTRFGNYVVDWRRVRHYVVPDLSNTKLTPFVAGNVYKNAELPIDPDGNPYHPSEVDGTYYLRWWKNQNMNEVEWFEDPVEDPESSQASEAFADSEVSEGSGVPEVPEVSVNTKIQLLRDDDQTRSR